jgi:Thymidylate synthase
MHVINVRNVCEALPIGVALLREKGVVEETRAGPALVMPCPVTTVIARPTERVLFSARRDANPAFHLFESIWMLAGRRDAAPLNKFVRDFGKRFAEPDGTIHGAYGHRWREAFEIDQLDEAVTKFKRSPSTRQVVIQMWHAPLDLIETWRDIPCNTHLYLRVRGGVLDLTICCRSNDVIWGAYGANAVHFSVLQEYLAARIRVGVGILYQVSNNYHGYLSTLGKVEGKGTIDGLSDNRYFDSAMKPLPMFQFPDHIDQDIRIFMDCFDNRDLYPAFVNPWFNDTLVPAIQSYLAYRSEGWGAAVVYLPQIKALDWRVAFTEWYMRRNNAKQGTDQH